MINMKLNFDNQFLNLVGYPLKEKMDDTLANALAISTEGDAEKMIKWAMSLVNYGELDINEDEIMYLKNFIKTNKTLTNIAKAQLLDRLDKGLNDMDNVNIEG